MGTAATIGSALIGAYASDRAASKQAKAQRKSIAAQNELVGPFSDAGAAALPAVQEFVDTGANFSDTQAFKDIINTQKARGQSLSGNTLTSLTDYYATNFRPQRFNELKFLPTLGANAATGQATNIGNAYTNIGSAQAAGTLGMANSLQDGMSFLNLLNTSTPTQNLGFLNPGHSEFVGPPVPGR
ncbi:MAG: hypothetical protein KOO63_08245 [Bacteroidales bacterium]|nr:hypothetical protein [Candidatus Latescibacterota bacterium]